MDENYRERCVTLERILVGQQEIIKKQREIIDMQEATIAMITNELKIDDDMIAGLEEDKDV